MSEAPQPSDDEASAQPSRKAGLRKALGHPLVLLLVGAVVSSYVIPLITRSWQDHQKELEIKTALVTEMTGKFADFLAAIQFVEAGGDPTEEDRKRANDAYQQWLRDGAVLASKLRAYYPEEDISVQWRRLSRVIEDLYAHTATVGQVEEGRIDNLEPIRRAVQDIEPGSEAAAVVLAEERRRLDRYKAVGHTRLWAETKAELIGRKDALVERVLEAEVEAF